jgi:hypothetical protein
MRNALLVASIVSSVLSAVLPGHGQPAPPTPAVDLLVEDVPLPSDVAVSNPQNVPENLKGFSGAWVGAWGRQLRHILVVEGCHGRWQCHYRLRHWRQPGSECAAAMESAQSHYFRKYAPGRRHRHLRIDEQRQARCNLSGRLWAPPRHDVEDRACGLDASGCGNHLGLTRFRVSRYGNPRRRQARSPRNRCCKAKWTGALPAGCL